MMTRRLLVVLGLSVLAVGCPGAKTPVAPPPPANAAPPDEGPLVWHLSKSGLGFRLSNADAEGDAPLVRKITPSTPLGGDDAKRLAARMPELKADPDDQKDFSMRAKSIPAPRPGKTVNESFPPPDGPPPANVPPPGPLVVERHAPEGPVELAPMLTMTFSQPMVAVTGIDEIAKEKLPITLTPQPPGKWRWLGTRTLMFQPEKRFPMATEYAVDVPAGTRAANGQSLAKPEHWVFSTPPVTLKSHWPNGSSEPREPILFAEFDQAIEPADMLKSIELSSGRGQVGIQLASADEVEANDAVRRMSQQAEKGRWVAFKAEGKLPTATSFSVRIKAGAPSAEGPRRTTKDQAFGFSTYGPMKLQQGYCGWWGNVHCVPLMPLELYFSNPIDLKTFDKKLVSVTPAIPNMKIEVNGNTITIRGKTKGRTHYDVRVAGTIGDVHGQTMGDEGKTQFDVGPADPAMFGAERDMVVLDPASPKVYTVYTINEPGLRTRIFKVEPEDWEKYVAFAQEWERPRKIAPPGKLVVDKVVATKKAPDELVSTSLDLAPALAGGLGQALVVVEPTGPLPKDTWRPELHVWVQSTDLGVDALVESDQITGWVTKLQDGAPVAGVDLQLLGAGSAKTDNEGLARVPLQAKDGRLVVARQGKDTAIVPEQWFGVPSYHLEPRPDQVRWLVFDDRGMYKPGEDVRVKGFVRRAGMSRGGDLDRIPNASGKTVTFTVRDPRWAEIGKGTTTVDDQGGFDLQFKLPNNANLGSAHVELAIPVGLTGDTYQHGFEIQEFRRPEFEVTAHASEGPNYVGKHAIATVDAKYYSGGGLADAPVNWSVTRSTGTFTPPNRGDFHFGPEPSYFYSWSAPNDPKRQPKTETWTSHTNPQGTHRLRIDFDALDPPYPMSLALTAMVEDVNRQQWAGRTNILVHPSDYYVGLRLNKQFIRAGENIDVDLVVTDVDGKRVPGRKVAVKAARLDWEQVGSEYEQKEVDVQTCDTTVPESGPTETARCSMRAPNGGSWKVWAVVEDEHGRKNQSATQLWVMSNDMPKDRSLDKGKATVVLDKKEYKPGDLAEVLVVAPFAPAEGILTVRRQGIVHLERFSMKTISTALKVKLEDAHVPNVGIGVQLVGQDVRENAAGDPDPSLPKRLAYASGSVGVNVLPAGRTLTVKATPKAPALEPGSQTAIDVDVKDPQGKGVGDAEVAVVVADEAVLALSGYTTPDPIAVFYSNRDTSLHELAIRDRVLLSEPDLARLRPEQGQMRAAPGGGFRGHMGPMRLGAGGGMPPPPPAAAPAAAASATTAGFDAAPLQKVAREESDKKKSGEKNDRDDVTKSENKPEKPVSDQKTPIAMRKDFSPLALFAPRVRTDGAGHATVQLKLPDNLTRYRVMAIAAAGDKMFGGGESTITARLPLQVRPSAPRFLNFGDKFELPIVVQNQTDAPVDVGIVVRATNATIDSPDAKRVKIAPNDRAEVRFGAAAVKAGTARFQIGVAAGNFADASEIELPVYTPATTEAFATYGEVDEGATAQLVKMPPNVFPQFGGLEITTSSTQLQALTDAVLYLVKYPFECNEQISSRVITIAALRDVLAAFKTKDMPKPEVLLASMQGDFEKLKRRQHWDGGWGFWQETPWPYLTVHVTHALVRAKEKGFKPDEQMLARAQGYLRSIESKFPGWYEPEWRRAITAYALYVRKRMGDADPQAAKRLIQEAGGVDKTPIETLGWLWPTISEDKNSTAENEAIRRFVANRVTETAGNAHFVSGYQDGDWVLLSSDRRADGVLLEAMIGDQPQSTLIPKLVSGLLAHRKAGHWTNTQENAFVLLALDRYFHEYEKITPDFVARVWLGDRFAGEHAFKGRTTERDQIAIPMQWLATETKGAPQNLVLGKDGPGRMYYRIGMQYAPTDLKLPPVDAGFVVQREYEGAENPADVKRDPDGTWRIKAGAKVRIRVQMVNQSRRYHVALVDNLPAGLEPMNPALAVTGEIPKDPKETTSKGKGRYWFWSQTWYEHQNMRDERVEAFASLLWEGVWDYTYVARATTPGTFVAPPPKAEEMYAPETFGRGAGDRVVIE